jgi:hypothetical protein
VKTYISWDPSVENDEKIVRVLPETAFECPKLSRGNQMTLDVGRSRGPRTLTMVKVVDVSIGIGWDSARRVKQAQIRDAEQYVYVEPVIIEPRDQPWPALPSVRS